MTISRVLGQRAFDLAALALLVGAIVHVGAWSAGPWSMAALGAPPSIVASRAAGSWPALLGTLAIATLLGGLALACFMVTRVGRVQRTQRFVLTLISAIFLVRGSLALPFIFADRREWQTPIGHFVAAGQWFVVGSVVVLAIGVLIGIGLIQSRSALRALTQA